MKRIVVLLVPAALFAAQVRYARLGEFEGKAEVQLHAADPWMAAERNLPLPESAWVRTGTGARLEIELDEGSTWRLGSNSQSALADYSRLSTGQRITLLSLDRGVAYFTGQPEGRDALILAVPGAQVSLMRGARVRLEAQEQWSQISVIEGTVRFSSPAAEIDLREGQTTRVEPANPARFFLTREIAQMELDRWSEDRDKALESSTSAGHVLQRYGLVDLDAAGEWVQTEDLGAVWKPKAASGWAPFQSGRWRWYPEMGYTWIGDEPWGWLPYHYGRWTRRENVGWVWVPARSATFKPGDVYWMLGQKLAGWGPLAPGEEWTAAGTPRQYLSANTTFAVFQADALAIDPAGFTGRPKEPLAAAPFVAALPSPAFVAARLEFERPLLGAGKTRVTPEIEGATLESAAAPPPVVVVNPAPPPPVVIADPPPDPRGVPPVYYPVPVYSPPVIIGVPDHPDYARPFPRFPGQSTQKVNTPPTVPAGTASPAPQSNPPVQRQHGSGTPTPANPGTQRPTPGGSGSSPKPNSPVPARPPVVTEREKKLFGEATSHLEKKDYSRALEALDTWSLEVRMSEFQDVRLYYYMQAYNGLRQPTMVLNSAARLLSPGRQQSLEPQQMLAALYLATTNATSIGHPTGEQVLTGRRAAQLLLQSVPGYFTPANKPEPISESDWTKARDDLMAMAKSALSSMGGR